MNPRQRRFVEEYARLKNGKQAALAAGYPASCAAPMASKFLRKPEIQEALIAAGVELAFAQYGPKPASRVAPFLTPRQERFVEHYLVLAKGAEAARRAGYSARSAHSIADRLLNTPRVAAAISSAQAERAARLRVDASRVLEECARLSYADARNVLVSGPQGLALKPPEEMRPEDSAAIAEVSLRSGKRGTRLKVKLFDKLGALTLLAKHLGLLAPKQQQDWRESETIAGRDAREELRERLLKLARGGE